MDFDKINTTATDIANSVLASVEKKKIVRDNIINLVAAACVTYNLDNNFKREVDAYIEYVRRTM